MTLPTSKLPPVTKWFDGKTTVPGQPGLYQREWHSVWIAEYPDYWDGQNWRYDSAIGPVAHNQNLRWRGLTEEVKS